MRYLKLHNLDAGEWYEHDQMMIESCFQILCNFMERDCPETTDWYHEKTSLATAWAELVSLYMWWKFTRPYRRTPLYDWGEDHMRPVSEWIVDRGDGVFAFVPDKRPGAVEAYQEQDMLDLRYLEEDQRNLHRLIEARCYMWA